MENVSDIPGGLRIASQAELNAKKQALSEAVLKDLGTQNNLAFTYGEGLQVYCQLEKTRWEWREALAGEVGLLTSNFIYPNGWIGDNKNYSLLPFNFFKLVSQDAKEKGIANGYTPLDSFAKVSVTYLRIVDDFITGGATSMASAETVKILKSQINGINAILNSGNVNLDTVQEIVDAIVNVQTSLSSIVVNDLTTGGATKAASAETVKILKSLVDALSSGKLAINGNAVTATEATNTNFVKVVENTTSDIDFRIPFVSSAGIFESIYRMLDFTYNPFRQLLKLVNATFTGSVIVPNATLSTQAVNKGQLDLKASITDLALKLAHGGYTGTAKELETLIVTTLSGGPKGNIIPSDTPTGTGAASWLTLVPGTYTNHGGFTVGANEIALFIRSATNVFTVSKTTLDFTPYAKTTETDSKLALKADLEIGKNLFNKNASDVTLGRYISISNGATIVNASYNATGFIPVIAGSVYSLSHTAAENAWYDVNKNFLSGFNAGTPKTAPTGAAFVRVTVVTANWNVFQFELGSTATTFEAYNLVIKLASLPKIPISLLSDLSITGTKIADKTITKEKTTFIQQGKNLFNKNALDITVGSYVLIANGSLGANADYNATGFMPVTVGLQYTMNNPIVENAWYNASKVFIGGFNATNPVTAPTDAVYARCSVRATDWNVFQFEQSATATAYETYYATLKSLDNSPIKADSLTANAITEAAAGIPVNSITGSKLAANTVTSDKTNFFENTKNLFNPYDANFLLSTYVTSTGVVGGSASASLTGFIPIVPGQTLFCNKAVMGGGYNCQYDSNKVFINSGMTNTSTITGVANAAFVRFSIQGTTLQTILNNLTQIEVGTVGTSYIPFSTIKANLLPPAQNLGNLVVAASDLQMPSALYLTEQKVDLFYAPIVKNYFKKDKFVRLEITNATMPRQFTRQATISPTANGVATFKLYDDGFNVVASKAVNTIITPTSKTGNLKAIFVGSSITGGGGYIEYMKTICGAGFTPLGMRHSSAIGVHHEGRGGWGLGTYFSPSTLQNIAYNGFLHPTTGRHWGSTAYWTDVMNNPEFGSTAAGAYDQNGFKTAATNAGFLTTGKIAGAKLLTNDIMYDNSLSSYIQWNGSAWNTIAAPSTWDLDFVKYSAMWNISIPDTLFLAELATNDFRGSETDPVFTTWNAQVEQFLTALKIWNTNVKLVVTLNFSTLGTEFSGGEFPQRNDYRMWQCRKNIIANFDNRVGAGIYVVDNGIGFDGEYGFTVTQDPPSTIPNQLYTGTEKLRVQIGNPHPDACGTNLLGQGLVGIVQYLRA